MPSPLQHIREAAIDGRVHNVIYRQHQLEKLHETLIRNAIPIEEAIARDSGNSAAEVRVEYLLTLLCLREYHESLDATGTLRSEYAIARGEDAPLRTEPVGVVYIVPTTHTLFYSVLVPLCAAIAAGNCVVIELQQSSSKVPSLLQTVIKTAIDCDIFEIVASPATDDQLGPHHTRVLQNGCPDLPTAMQQVSPSQARVVAVVDRTSNVVEAAKALVSGRFGFGGSSPYAPDLVLVNEFCTKDFLNAVVEQAVRLATDGESSCSADPAIDSLLEDAQKSSDVRLVTSMAAGKVFEVKNRGSSLLSMKLSGKDLLVLSIKSLDDAIDFANRDGNLLATYLFANPRASKYLSQFISSQVSFVNQVPTEMLVGPAAPLNAPVNRSLRYPIDLFQVPRAQYITPSSWSQLAAQVLQDSGRKASAKAFDEASQKLLPSIKRLEAGQVGFFEQGIFLGLGIFGAPVVLSLGVLGYYGARFALSKRA